MKGMPWLSAESTIHDAKPKTSTDACCFPKLARFPVPDAIEALTLEGATNDTSVAVGKSWIAERESPLADAGWKAITAASTIRLRHWAASVLRALPGNVRKTADPGYVISLFES